MKDLFQGYGVEWQVFDTTEREEHSLFCLLFNTKNKTQLFMKYRRCKTCCYSYIGTLNYFADILAGSVGLFNNYNLCHIKTINWDEIITGPEAKYVFVYNFSLPERSCSPCHNSCKHGCWGEGPDNCQRFSKVHCSPQCWQGRCFGTNPRECCHLFCAGGCTGPKQSDCLVSEF